MTTLQSTWTGSSLRARMQELRTVDHDRLLYHATECDSKTKRCTTEMREQSSGNTPAVHERLRHRWPPAPTSSPPLSASRQRVTLDPTSMPARERQRPPSEPDTATERDWPFRGQSGGIAAATVIGRRRHVPLAADLRQAAVGPHLSRCRRPLQPTSPRTTWRRRARRRPPSPLATRRAAPADIAAVGAAWLIRRPGRPVNGPSVPWGNFSPPPRVAPRLAECDAGARSPTPAVASSEVAPPPPSSSSDTPMTTQTVAMSTTSLTMTPVLPLHATYHRSETGRQHTRPPTSTRRCRQRGSLLRSAQSLRGPPLGRSAARRRVQAPAGRPRLWAPRAPRPLAKVGSMDGGRGRGPAAQSRQCVPPQRRPFILAKHVRRIGSAAGTRCGDSLMGLMLPTTNSRLKVIHQTKIPST